MGHILKILHVDDNKNDRSLVRSALKEAHLSVSIETVTSGRGAIEYLVERLEAPEPKPLPDLLLLDLKMPGLDGIGVLGCVRGDERLRKMKVYVLTSSDLPRDKDIALRLGATSWWQRARVGRPRTNSSDASCASRGSAHD